MKRSFVLPVWLWAIQAVTGLLLVLYVIIHTIDNALILISQKAFEEMLGLWHSIWPWFYILMVIGLTGLFLIHALNGIRIASKPYKDIDVSWKHNLMLKHSGTTFWYVQVLTGSVIAIFGIWHLIVQHGGDATMEAWQSAERISPIVFLLYLLFMAALMFHSFNGIRSIIIKLGFMTDKSKESILIGLMAFLFIIFFLMGVFSIAKFLPDKEAFQPVAKSVVHQSDEFAEEQPVEEEEPVSQLEISREGLNTSSPAGVRDIIKPGSLAGNDGTNGSSSD